MSSITDFERRLFLAYETKLDEIDEIRIREGYFEAVYTREDLEAIGEIIVEEQYQEWLLATQGQKGFEAEIERQAREKTEYDAWCAEQCELASKEKEVAGHDAA